MIITRTPYRISFVGGGTDLKSFYKNQDGEVISSTIDKYLYVVARKQLGFVEYKYRINWSNVEFCNSVNSIKHPIVREALRYFKINFPLEITTFADIPASTGLGSSSAFAVGLVHALSAIQNMNLTKYQIADISSKIEIDILKRSIGKQDHFASTYGNFNKFIFKSDDTVKIKPIPYNKLIKKNLENNLLLFYTGIKRDASNILVAQNKNSKKNNEKLIQMKNLTENLTKVLIGSKTIGDFGKILHKNWLLKKDLSKGISSKKIDYYYNLALKNGATGGKLLGAGGGGFLLFYANKKYKNTIIKKLKDLSHLNFKFDDSGSRITYYDNN